MENVLTYGKIVIAVVSGFFTQMLGGYDALLSTLIWFVVLDYLSGLIAAYRLKELNSKVGFLGIAKKFGIFIVVAVAVGVGELLGGSFPLREIAVSFYLANEALSILENAGRIGLPIPDALLKALEQLKKDKEE